MIDTLKSGISKVKGKIFSGTTAKNSKAPENSENAETNTETASVENATVRIGDVDVPLTDLVALFKAKKEAKSENSGELNPDDEIEIADGDKVKVSELVALWEQEHGTSAENSEAKDDDKKDESAENSEDKGDKELEKAANSKSQKVKENGTGIKAIKTAANSKSAGFPEGYINRAANDDYVKKNF